MVAMSLADAKVVLGFPPDAQPTAAEIQKAYRDKIIQNKGIHPDLGGDASKLVELNVAKDILEGKQRPTYERPAPPPPPPASSPPGHSEQPRGQEVTFEEAKGKAGIPGGVTWMFVTEVGSSGYSSDEFERRASGYVVYGQTDSKHVFVAVEHLNKADYFVGGGPSIDMWNIREYDYPRKEGEVLQPAWLYGNIVKGFKGFKWLEKRFNSKVQPLPEGWHFQERLPHVGKSVSIKHWLVNQGLVSGDDPSVVNRKNTVELVYNQKGLGSEEQNWFVLVINGREYKLSDRDSQRWITPSKYRGPATFVFGDYFYGGSKKNLTRLSAARRKKVFDWMAKNLMDLPPEAKAVIDAEASK